MKTTANHIAICAAALTLLLFADLPTATADAPVQPSPIGQMASVLNPANWSMPKWKMPNFKQLLPGKEEKTRIKKKKEGLVSEVTKTASNSWNKTKRALDPQKLNPTKFFTASARTPAYKRGQDTKPGFFRSLFAPPEPPQDNSTVTDFLRQARPGQ